jgi:hypothetical protein
VGLNPRPADYEIALGACVTVRSRPSRRWKHPRVLLWTTAYEDELQPELQPEVSSIIVLLDERMAGRVQRVEALLAGGMTSSVSVLASTKVPRGWTRWLWWPMSAAEGV